MNEPSTLVTILSLIISSLFAGMCYITAKKRGRNEKLWAVLGLFFGVFAVLALYLFPKKGIPPTTPIQEQAGPISSIHNESAASLEDDESFEIPRQKRLSSSRSLDWYYIDPSEDNAINGPHKIKELREVIHMKKLDCNTYIWCEEFDEWTVISEFSNASLILDADFID